MSNISLFDRLYRIAGVMRLTLSVKPVLASVFVRLICRTMYTFVQVIRKGGPANKGQRFTEIKVTRMWADAKGAGRPAEYRWRPLFNAAKFG